MRIYITYYYLQMIDSVVCDIIDSKNFVEKNLQITLERNNKFLMPTYT